jgi:GNAT superfamily N-acetyltransferase
MTLIRPSARRAGAEDAGALGLLGAATFLETYALTLNGPDIVTHCAKHHAPEVYARWIADPNCAVWLAEAGEGQTAVGFSVLTSPDLPGAEAGDLELRRIYVLAPFQGFGLGRTFVQLAADEARRRGARRLLLGVYGVNEAAMAFYARMGFEQIGTREFVVGQKTCFDYVLALSLE